MSVECSQDEVLLISIKPEYATKIFTGEKTIELRKSAPKKAAKGSYILIYVTAPVKELRGICKIENIIKEDPEELWENFGEKMGISKREYSNYYGGKRTAFGIELKEIINLLDRSIKLDFLKDMIPGFSPPQTYRYLNHEMLMDSDLKELIL